MEINKKNIINGLDCCTRGRKDKNDRPCLDCLYNECNLVGGTSERQTTGTCQGWLMKDALALIKQQDEQIFKLENRLKECENGYSQTLGIERAKIKALTEKNERLSACTNLVPTLNEVKADIVRKIADLLWQGENEKLNIIVGGKYYDKQRFIDQIANEILNVNAEEIDSLKEKFEGEGKDNG